MLSVWLDTRNDSTVRELKHRARTWGGCTEDQIQVFNSFLLCWPPFDSLWLIHKRSCIAIVTIERMWAAIIHLLLSGKTSLASPKCSGCERCSWLGNADVWHCGLLVNLGKNLDATFFSHSSHFWTYEALVPLQRLTGGTECGSHLTDVTNASRTMLMNLESLDWDNDLCE